MKNVWIRIRDKKKVLDLDPGSATLLGDFGLAFFANSKPYSKVFNPCIRGLEVLVVV
jgi:hypothetical protein